MGPILNLGTNLVLFLQSLGAWLATPFLLITYLGNELFYLFIAPAIYWCFDARLGLRIGLSLMISGIVNSVLKLAFHGPRPYWYDSRVTAYSSETSFGAPSGHSQNSVIVWGILAAWLNKTWAWIVAGVIIFLVGLSRIYLGVHFPHDVILGWIIGALLLWAILAWEKRFIAWFTKYKPPAQVLIVFGISLFFIILGALARLSVTGGTIPVAWIANASHATPKAPPINPLALADLFSGAGAFFGMACGAILIKMRGGFFAGGPAGLRVVRFLVGVIGVGLIWFGLDVLFPGGESLLPYILRYLRYTLVGMWITGFAPLLFIRLRLAASNPQS